MSFPVVTEPRDIKVPLSLRVISSVTSKAGWEEEEEGRGRGEERMRDETEKESNRTHQISNPMKWIHDKKRVT